MRRLRVFDTIDIQRRFGGTARLFGAVAAQAIQSAHVVVVGLGGVGSWAAEALARAGVGALTLIDFDHLAESNINRQLHALDATLGQSKVEAMAQRIAAFAPHCRVRVVDAFVTPDNWPGLLDAQAVDAVLDACDQISAKRTLAAWALAQRVRLIVCGAAGGKCDAAGVRCDDLLAVTHDPLLAKLRYSLRKSGALARDARRAGVMCVFSREPVRAPVDAACAHDASLNCHGYGSVVTVTATFGLVAAGWVLQQLAQSARAAQTLC
ncbi:MAG: tRNA cyclic N6-threonylcarbamoyladenosine(37) synthase TcdA [Rhodoferax sp.]